MLRISGITAALNLFGLGKHGFRDGNKTTGVVATKLTAAVFNAWQEEKANVVEMAGLTLDPDDNTQMFQAFQKMITSSLGLGGEAVSDYLSFPYKDRTTGVTKYKIIQWGLTSSIPGDSSVTVTFPIAFPTVCNFVLPIAISANPGIDNFGMLISKTNTQAVIARGDPLTNGGVPQSGALMYLAGGN